MKVTITGRMPRITASLLALAAPVAMGAEFPCLPQVAVPLTVRIGGSAPTAALLEGGFETPLMLLELATKRLLWSAGHASTAMQVFPGMQAGFTGSLAAIDLDGDGLHDRVYAGDMAARLWRFDLHHGQIAAQWATGGVFADFSNAEGRGFLAAPDISLAAPPHAPPWLNLAIGTAAPGNPAANNRFYALRDHAVHESWTGAQYEQWQAWREEDLTLVNGTVGDASSVPTALDPASPGWYVELGSGHVITPTITVNDRAVLAIAEAMPRASGSCEIFARVASLDLPGASILPAAPPGTGSTHLAHPIPADSAFTVGQSQEGTAPCTLGGHRIAGCDVDTRPRKTWWRRTDAE